jgi:hypothetical protein
MAGAALTGSRLVGPKLLNRWQENKAFTTDPSATIDTGQRATIPCRSNRFLAIL